jgi:hypothetical protein
VNVAWTSPLPISRDMAASMDEAAAALIGLVILVVLRGGRDEPTLALVVLCQDLALQR